jgi:hypothetical protein
MNNFLPDSYNIPETPSNYMRFVEGANTFRILSSAIVGFEYFNLNNKPVRSKEAFEEMPQDIKQGGKIKPFWAFCIYNYDLKMVQILELTQKSIMTAIKATVDNPKWGNPRLYDFTITRSGEGLDTEYVTQAEPPIGEPSDEIKEAFINKPINLSALFESGDPFAK